MFWTHRGPQYLPLLNCAYSEPLRRVPVFERGPWNFHFSLGEGISPVLSQALLEPKAGSHGRAHMRTYVWRTALGIPEHLIHPVCGKQTECSEVCWRSFSNTNRRNAPGRHQVRAPTSTLGVKTGAQHHGRLLRLTSNHCSTC